MDCFVPRDDAKRQWGQSPERTTLFHPDMQCRVLYNDEDGYWKAAAIDPKPSHMPAWG